MSFIASLTGFIDQLLPPVPPGTQVNTNPRKVVQNVLRKRKRKINIYDIPQIQPPVLPLSVVKTEPLPIVKIEPPESDVVEIATDDILDSSDKIIPDIKNIDIVSHELNEDLIKSEIVSKDIHKSKHMVSIETQDIVKTEYLPLLKVENIIQTEIVIKSEEDTSDEYKNRGVVEPQDSNALDNLDTDKQLVLNCSSDLNGISIKTDFAENYGTCEITLLKGYKEKVKIIEAPVIPVEIHEYTSLAKDNHVCNYCQSASKNVQVIIAHIMKMHRKNHTTYVCSYCPFKTQWKSTLQNHIIVKHKDPNVHKDIQWFKCHLCDAKFKLKALLKKHIFTHMQDKLKLCPVCGKGFKAQFHVRSHVRMVHNKESLKRYKCDECEYTTYNKQYIKLHIENHHREPHECSECDYKTKYKKMLKRHKKIHEIRYCDKCPYKCYSNQEFYRHKLNHLEPEEIQYFYCYHCPYRSKQKDNLKTHILRHCKQRDLITKDIKEHPKVQNESEL